MRVYAIIRLKKGIDKRSRSKVAKTLLGTTVVVKGRKYRSHGMLKHVEGIRLCPGTYLVPVSKLYDFLKLAEEKGIRDYLVLDLGCTCSCMQVG